MERERFAGLGSRRASGGEQVPATCLRVENTGLLHLGRLSRGKPCYSQQSLTHGAFGVARVWVLFYS
jgi:hypothetical protein